MPAQSLTLRRNQIALLRDGCDAQFPAAIYRRRSGARPTVPNTRLLTLDDDAVWIQAPIAGLLPAHWDGATVDVCFERGELSYRFTAETTGRFERSFDRVGETAALRLSLPIRVERWDPHERREDVRVHLAPGALDARVVHMTNRRQTLPLQLRDISLGGCGGGMAAMDLEAVDRSSPYWVELTLEPDRPPLDFAAQLVHTRLDAESDQAVVGWRFCAGDDDLGYRENLRRLQEYIEQRQSSA